MPDEQHEIVKYEFQADSSDLEAKAQRARALASATGDTAGFKAWRQQERTAAALNRPYDEAAAQAAKLAELTAAEKNDSAVTQELSEHKRQLGTVVNLRGGSFGGSAAQVVGLVGAMMTATPALMGSLAAGAGLAAVANWYREIAAEAERAAAAQREFNAAVAEAQQVKGERLATLGEQLEPYGMRSEATARNAEEVQGKLGEVYGSTAARGTRAAGLAASMGGTVEDAAHLRVAMGAGAQLSTPEDANRSMAEAKKSGEWDTLLQQAEAFKGDVSGQHNRILAAAPLEGGRAGEDPVAAAYEGLKKQPGGLAASGLPANLASDDFRAGLAGDTLAIARALYPGQKKINELEFKKAAEATRGLSGARGYVKQARAIQAGQDHVGSTEMFNEPPPPLSEDDLTTVLLGLPPAYAGQPGQRVQTSVQNFNNTTHIGTAYNDRDGPARQREQRPHFNLDQVDIKAPY